MGPVVLGQVGHHPKQLLDYIRQLTHKADGDGLCPQAPVGDAGLAFMKELLFLFFLSSPHTAYGSYFANQGLNQGPQQ